MLRAGEEEWAVRLPEGFRSILAGFPSEEAARRAAGELRRMGFESVQVERVSLHPGEEGRRRQQPLSGRIESLAGLTLGADVDNPDRGAALAADPSASGLASGPLAQQWPYLLTAVVPREQAGRVAEVVRRHGGHL